MACIDEHIDHRLTAPFTPKSNGMAERVNGTINLLSKQLLRQLLVSFPQCIKLTTPILKRYLNMQEDKKIKVYYNSACPVCKAGINSQKNKKSQCEIDWNDVHSNNDYADDVSDSLEFVRERLHVIDENNTVKIGIEAFIVIWQHSPQERWKAKILSLPIINPIANIVYNRFARLLYLWNRKKGNG